MYLMHQGSTQTRVCHVAAALLNVIRVMDISVLRAVEISEIDIAAEVWRSKLVARCRHLPSEASAMAFRRTALNWLQFHGSVIPEIAEPKPYGETLSEYRSFVNFTVSPCTAARYSRCADRFLTSTQKFQPTLSRLSTVDIDRFIESRRSIGYRPSSLANVCASLRHFLRFTESRGWTPPKLSRMIKSPRVRRYDQQDRGPRWRDVRRLLAAGDNGEADVRARAMMFLCAIYALRASEVANLNLNDFDWVDETFTVRRAKSRIVQRFPLQYEVGEAILRYLQMHRPKCASRLLFVTLSTPYRSVSSTCLSGLIRDRMRRLKIQAPSIGAHSLRRSCATELLRKGVSLANIADFLGHQDLSTVSVYAKCSVQSLRDVALVSLEGLL